MLILASMLFNIPWGQPGDSSPFSWYDGYMTYSVTTVLDPQKEQYICKNSYPQGLIHGPFSLLESTFNSSWFRQSSNYEYNVYTPLRPSTEVHVFSMMYLFIRIVFYVGTCSAQCVCTVDICGPACNLASLFLNCKYVMYVRLQIYFIKCLIKMSFTLYRSFFCILTVRFYIIYNKFSSYHIFSTKLKLGYI